ncbi:MAG: trehalose synthase, partial [Mycobacterium sp.]
YGPERVNAADQRHDHESFWWFMRNLIYTYRSQPEIGWATVDVLKQANPAVLAHVCREESGWAMVALHNFGSDSAMVPIELEDAPPGSKLVDLLDGLSEHELDGKGRIEMSLAPYGYRWLRLLRPQDDPII